MKTDHYYGPYMHKSAHHIYIKPSKEIQSTVAHYTITFPSQEPVSCERYHILPDASGCFILQGEDTYFWGPMQELVIQENDLAWAKPRFFIEFQRGGLYRIAGKELAPYMNQRGRLTDFDETIDQIMRGFYEQSEHYEELIKTCNTWIAEQIQHHSIPPRILQATACIEQTHGNIAIEQIAATCAISLRQLRRDFATYIGLSPKQYANVIRINSLVKALSKDELIEQALNGGFFDQSHFNKMFKQILHVTPSQYIRTMDDFYREIFKF